MVGRKGLTTATFVICLAVAASCGSDAIQAGEETDTMSDDLAPVGNPDVFFTVANQRLRVGGDAGVLRNDIDPEEEMLRVLSTGGVTAHGALFGLRPSGALDFAPVEDDWGRDRLTYTVGDPHGNEAEAEATVFIAPTKHTIDPDTLGDRGFSLFMSHVAAWGKREAQAVGVGDFNGDGTNDLLLSDDRVREDGMFRGRAYVVYGGAVDRSMELADLEPGTEGFVIEPEDGQRCCGLVRPAGDVNGDGLADIMVGERRGEAYRDQVRTRRVFVIFGTRDEPSSMSLDAIARGEGGFVVVAEGGESGDIQDGDRAGDLNADGKEDLVFGAPWVQLSEGSGGRAYVVWGHGAGPPTLLEDVAAGIGGIAASLPIVDTQLGNDVGGVGDFNADGFDDILLAGTSGSRAYIVFGRPGEDGLPLVRSGNTGGLSFPGAGPSLSQRGQVASHGDINGDGVSDVALVDREDSSIWVVFGSAQIRTVDLQDLEMGRDGFAVKLPTSASVGNMAIAPDVNGDGFDDLLIATGGYDEESLRLYAVYGGAEVESFEAEKLAAGTRGFRFRPEFGEYSTAQGIGDINGDGIGDILFGPHHSEQKRTRVDILYGVPTGDTCCRAHALPGCTDDVVEACVCESDDACCTAAWTPECAELAAACGSCD